MEEYSKLISTEASAKFKRIRFEAYTMEKDAILDACRERTLAHLELPADESFTVEYVTDKTWSGYNWYQGDYQSLIQKASMSPQWLVPWQVEHWPS